MPRPHGRPGLYNRFRQTEASRLMKAVAAAGLEVASVECDPATGKVVVTPKHAAASTETAANPWDGVKCRTNAEKKAGFLSSAAGTSIDTACGGSAFAVPDSRHT